MSAGSFEVHLEHDAEVLTVYLRGALDTGAAEAVDAGLRDALFGSVGSFPTSPSPTVRRVDVDLDDVGSFTDEGVAALVRCRELTSSVPDGLRYRATSMPGRRVLLATCRTDAALM